jgi:hypothetical protein
VKEGHFKPISPKSARLTVRPRKVEIVSLIQDLHARATQYGAQQQPENRQQHHNQRVSPQLRFSWSRVVRLAVHRVYGDAEQRPRQKGLLGRTHPTAVVEEKVLPIGGRKDVLHTVEVDHRQEFGANDNEANERQAAEDYDEFSVGADAAAQHDKDKGPDDAEVEGQLSGEKFS